MARGGADVVSRSRMVHEPRDAGALAMQALRNARIAQIATLILALVCLGVDAKDALTALAGVP